MKSSQANEYLGKKFVGRGNRKSNGIKSRKKPGIFEKGKGQCGLQEVSQ